MNAMQSSTRKRTVAKKRVTNTKGISALRLKWCDVTDWWEYDLTARQRNPIVVLCIIAIAALLAAHWL